MMQKKYIKSIKKKNTIIETDKDFLIEGIIEVKKRSIKPIQN